MALSQWKIFLMSKMLTADRSGKCIRICEEKIIIEQRDKISMRSFEGSPYRVPASFGQMLQKTTLYHNNDSIKVPYIVQNL